MKRIAGLWIILLGISPAFGLTTSKPGPHHGFVSKTGTFYLEVLPQKDGYVVFLLDSKLQNPSVKDSALKAKIVYDKNDPFELICTAQTETFFCPAPPDKMQHGELIILASHLKSLGKPVHYPLPLQWPDSSYD
jgi:hypothetical protein